MKNRSWNYFLSLNAWGSSKVFYDVHTKPYLKLILSRCSKAAAKSVWVERLHPQDFSNLFLRLRSTYRLWQTQVSIFSVSSNVRKASARVEKSGRRTLKCSKADHKPSGTRGSGNLHQNRLTRIWSTTTKLFFFLHTESLWVFNFWKVTKEFTTVCCQGITRRK